MRQQDDPKEWPSSLAEKRFVCLLNWLSEQLNELDEFGTFELPVTEDIAPGYFDLIAQPMSYSEIDANIKAGVYSTFEAVVADYQLVYDNAMEYNPEGSDVHDFAQQQSSHLARLVSEADTFMDPMRKALTGYTDEKARQTLTPADKAFIDEAQTAARDPALFMTAASIEHLRQIAQLDAPTADHPAPSREERAAVLETVRRSTDLDPAERAVLLARAAGCRGGQTAPPALTPATGESRVTHPVERGLSLVQFDQFARTSTRKTTMRRATGALVEVKRLGMEQRMADIDRAFKTLAG